MPSNAIPLSDLVVQANETLSRRSVLITRCDATLKADWFSENVAIVTVSDHLARSALTDAKVLLFPSIQQDDLQDPHTAKRYMSLATTAIAQGLRILAATPHQLRFSPLITCDDAPWDLDVDAIVAPLEFEHLLVQHCAHIPARSREDGPNALYLTPIERKMRSLLLGSGHSFKAQEPIGAYVVDFLVDDRLIIECDGAGYHDSAKDQERDHALATRGYKTLRFSGQKIVSRPEECIARINRALAGQSKLDVGSSLPTTPLTPAQEEACAHRVGPALVVAPAGSGKTLVIQQRVSRLIATGVDPSRICAISFTNKAVEEMRTRLPETAADVHIATVHSLANEICRQTYGVRENVQKARPHGTTRQHIVRQILRPEEYLAIPRSISLWVERIGHFRSGYVIPELDDLLPGCTRTAARDRFIDVHRQYEEHLNRLRATDFTGMILDAIRALATNAERRHQIATRYEYWIVDEFQDMPPSQLQLLRLLVAPRRNLFAVGDDDQVIYGFAGSTPEIFSADTNIWGDRARYSLDVNFRCPHELVLRTRWLIDRNKKRVLKRITPNRAPDQTAHVETYDYVDYERKALEFVKQELSRGIAPHEIALLFRLRDMAIPVEKILQEYRIPFLRLSAGNFFDSKPIKWVRSWLRIVSNHAKPNDYSLALKRPKRYLTNAIVDDISHHKLPEARILGYISGEHGCIATDTQRDALNDFITTVCSARRVGINPTSILDTLELENLAPEVGEVASNASPRVQVQIFARFADHFPDVSSVEQWIHTESKNPDYCIDFARSNIEADNKGRIQLLTVHKSKGLEFKSVAVLGPPSSFPDKRAVDPAAIEEERRVAYVAATRAKEQLLFCCSTQYSTELSTRPCDELTWAQYKKLEIGPSPGDSVRVNWERFIAAHGLVMGVPVRVLNSPKLGTHVTVDVAQGSFAGTVTKVCNQTRKILVESKLYIPRWFTARDLSWEGKAFQTGHIVALHDPDLPTIRLQEGEGLDVSRSSILSPNAQTDKVLEVDQALRKARICLPHEFPLWVPFDFLD